MKVAQNPQSINFTSSRASVKAIVNSWRDIRLLGSVSASYCENCFCEASWNLSAL